MTENTLPATVDDIDTAALAVLTGQKQENASSGPYLPKLAIQRDFVVNDEGDPVVKAGWFNITVNGQVYYMKTPIFRAFFNGFKDSLYNQDANDGKGAMVCESLIITDWGQEMLDTCGTQRCGKLSKGKMETLKKEGNLTEDMVAKNRKIQTYRMVYGVVRTEGEVVDVAGNPLEFPKGSITVDDITYELDGVPCYMTLRGNNFMPFNDEVVEPLNKQSRLMIQFENAMSTTRQVSEANGEPFYVAHFEFDLTKPVQISSEDLIVLKSIMELVNVHNDDVTKKHNEALREGNESSESEALVEDLENDFHDDEIPF